MRGMPAPARQPGDPPAPVSGRRTVRPHPSPATAARLTLFRGERLSAAVRYHPHDRCPVRRRPRPRRPVAREIRRPPAHPRRRRHRPRHPRPPPDHPAGRSRLRRGDRAEDAPSPPRRPAMGRGTAKRWRGAVGGRATGDRERAPLTYRTASPSPPDAGGRGAPHCSPGSARCRKSGRRRRGCGAGSAPPARRRASPPSG